MDIKINSVEIKDNKITILGTGIIDQIDKPETTSIVTYINHPISDSVKSAISHTSEKHYR